MKDHSGYVEEPDVVELKACPFCGKPPQACPDSSYGYAMVFCPGENDCPVAPVADADFSDGETLEEAIAKWNTRASTPPVTVDDVELVAREMAAAFVASRERVKHLHPAHLVEYYIPTGGTVTFDLRPLARAALEAIRNRPEGGRPLRGNHATREPSPSGLGPAGECQAQVDTLRAVLQAAQSQLEMLNEPPLAPTTRLLDKIECTLRETL